MEFHVAKNQQENTERIYKINISVYSTSLTNAVELCIRTSDHSLTSPNANLWTADSLS